MKTFKQFSEEMGMTTSAVPGAGDDSSTVIMRKKGDRKNRRDDNIAILRRYFPNKVK